MDFCVKCGRKELFEDHLCNGCYEHITAGNSTTKKGRQSKKRSITLENSKSKKIQRHAGYFEATIQLRGVSQEVVDLLYREMRENNIKVSKETWVKNGVDIQVDNKTFARQAVVLLQKRFGGMIKSSAKLFSRHRQTGKKIYRVTMLFKQFPYKRGEHFMFKGVDYILVSMGKNIVAEREDKKKKVLRYADLERARLF